MTQDPPPGLKWNIVYTFPGGPTDPNGNYKIDFHAWHRSQGGDVFEADTRDEQQVDFDHALCTVTLNRDGNINSNAPYYPKYWGSLAPQDVGRGVSQVYSVVWVACFDRVYRVKARIYEYRQTLFRPIRFAVF